MLVQVYTVAKKVPSISLHNLGDIDFNQQSGLNSYLDDLLESIRESICLYCFLIKAFSIFI